MTYNLRLSLRPNPSDYAPTARMSPKETRRFKQIFPQPDKAVWSAKRRYKAVMTLRDGTKFRWATDFDLTLSEACRGANRDIVDVKKFRCWKA